MERRVGRVTSMEGSARVVLLIRLLAIGIAVLLLAGAPASAHDERTRGPWPLVSLAALGTVTWRCDSAAKPRVAPGLPALVHPDRLVQRRQEVRQPGVPHPVAQIQGIAT